jgi:diguanylate cyclase (GGDEF)-like protein/PAS domain S-box-containing protein
LVLTARDITDRTLAEQRLARSEARFRSLVQNSSDVVAVMDATGSLTYVSPAVTPMLGFRAEELVGTNVMRLLPADEVSRAMRLLEAVTEAPFEQVNLEMRLRDRGGSWRNVDVTISDMRNESAVQGIVLNVRDVTVRRALEEDLQHKALHDELTGLGNRVYFEQRLNLALAREESRLDQVAVLLVDLDDFKEINDSLGHSVGDQLLMTIAERIRACLRVSDAAARQGGDEFVVLLEDTYGESEVFAVADRILLAISQPYHLDGRELTISASIGIVIDSDRSSTSDGLMRAADVAMYLAKDRGKGRYELFHEAAHASAFERLEMKAALVEAVRSGGLVLHYQPIVELTTGAITGCEALVRWDHPERGLISPAEFIPLAEDSGLIVALGRWVLNEACRQLGEWDATLPAASRLRVSVNLSVRQIESMTLISDVHRCHRGGGDHPRPAHPGDHRELGDERRPRHAPPAEPAAGAGDPPRRRRLRHRLLVARLHPAVPTRCHQDRPQLREPAGRADRRQPPAGAHHRRVGRRACTRRPWPRASRPGPSSTS